MQKQTRLTECQRTKLEQAKLLTKIHPMKRLLIFSLSIFAASNALCQTSYRNLTKEARELYNHKEYLKSGIIYSDAFKCAGDSILTFDRVAAASSWTQAGLPDSAFNQLFKVSQDSTFIYYNYLIVHQPDLIPLHFDGRWKSIIQRIKDNFLKKEIQVDINLINILDSVYQIDQLYQQKYVVIQNKFGSQSDEFKSFRSEMQKQYQQNLTKVSKIIDEQGWPGINKIGHEGNLALFLVIQHSNLDTQIKYLPLMREAVKNGNASPANLALLEDRVAVKQGKKQIYGTQIETDEKTGKSWLAPLNDPDNVDTRRKEIGLEKLSDYLSTFGIKWDLEEYKKSGLKRTNP